ncbi:DUF951 family protein [Candidatus Izemoplasma sp. B36]|uniref:DUF951 family protein n=1 Tax=Candidatus Izemoplasma sp. B36 TaxID=3242468 RepID=UPI0035567FBC
MNNQNLDIKEGSVLILKKGHPCGENLWEITSFGVICKIKCLGCGRIVIIDRTELKKRIKKVVNKDE